jgi:small-conductance mechanosensitive channel
LLSLAYGAVAGLIIVGFGRTHAPAADGAAEHADPADEARSPAWTLISLALTVAIIVIVGAVFAGYSTLAALVSNQIFWLSIIAAVTYLLLRLIDDACGAMFRKQGWAARALHAVFRLRNSTISQMGVLLSAGLQLLVVIGAISLALTPFGQSGELFLTHISRLGGEIRIGSATISPTAIATGLGTFAIGMALVHLVQGWVVRRYLPVTEWDAGLRNSVTTGVGYLGVGLALLCAMAAMGLGFQQIALVASALSVGIGFGLQQVVQNFVSGVILLIERPVKVGDWVNVNNVEGDVRRIRVRATEIQTFDRSTVIVPNSDLITKVVQNRTLGDPRGRIQMQISIASPGDAQKATDLILQAAKAKSQVLSEPAPAVFIDSLGAGGAVNFNCFLYVRNQRDVYRTRSELYFDIIQIFQKNDVAFVGSAGPTNIVVEPGPTMKNMLAAATNGSGGDKSH